MTRRFKLLQPLPLLAEFPSSSFRLRLDRWEVPQSWKLCMYVNGSRYTYFYVEGYSSLERAQEGLYVSGFEVNRCTVPEAVMLRLVQEGKAVELTST